MRHPTHGNFSPAAIGLYLLAIMTASGAQAAEHGRLPATGGALTFQGVAGGGIVPMAVLAGLSTDPGSDWLLGGSTLTLTDFDLATISFAASFDNRVELSLTRQRFGIDFDLPAGLPQHIDQNILGAKVRLAGDLIYGRLPQFSLGAQYQRVEDFGLAQALGARDRDGVDLYAHATRLFLDGPWQRNFLVNAGLRASRANATGLLGFGGGRHADYRLLGEASAALFFNPQWALGVEYRQQPANLDGVAASDWADTFLAWFPNRHASLVLAYTDFGNLAGRSGQRGWFLSLSLDP